MTTDEPSAQPAGARIKQLREAQRLSLSALARASGVSKGYIWSLENPVHNGPDKRPSARTLYAIAQALGTTVADLLGEPLAMAEHSAEPPDDSLLAFAAEDGVAQADVDMLASIQWRGDPPHTPDRWRHIYRAITQSSDLDDESVADTPPGRDRQGSEQSD